MSFSPDKYCFANNSITSRAKIKLLAKKSLETGEDLDGIPESMRQYLIMQGMQSGKGLGESFYGRAGLMPYGQTNLLLGGDQNGQGKVCEYSSYSSYLAILSSNAILTLNNSDPPSYLPVSYNRKVDACGTEYDGSHHFLLTR